MKELYENVLSASILPKLPVSNRMPPSRGGWKSAVGTALDPCLDHWFFISCNEGVDFLLSSCWNSNVDMLAQMVQLTVCSCRATSSRGARQVSPVIFGLLFMNLSPDTHYSAHVTFCDGLPVCVVDCLSCCCRYESMDAARLLVHKRSEIRQATAILIHSEQPSKT